MPASKTLSKNTRSLDFPLPIKNSVGIIRFKSKLKCNLNAFFRFPYSVQVICHRVGKRLPSITRNNPISPKHLICFKLIEAHAASNSFLKDLLSNREKPSFKVENGVGKSPSCRHFSLVCKTSGKLLKELTCST